MKKLIIDDFVFQFKNKNYVNKEEIREFFSSYYNNLSNSSFLWRLFELKEKGMITKISNDKYQINILKFKKSFSLSLPDSIVTKEVKKFNESLDFSNSYSLDEKLICMWDLSTLNTFTKHQYSKDVLFIEIDKYRIESLFYELNEKLSTTNYISKDYSKDYDHIVLADKIIVINALVKRAPLEKSGAKANNFVVPPKMEKIFVDIFANQEIFNMYDKSIIKEIFQNYYEKYNLDFTTLLYYAKNRGIREELKKFTIQTLEVNFDDN